jgi:hypothetical protein
VTAWKEVGVGKLLVTITSDIPIRVKVEPKTIRAATEAAAILTAAAAVLASGSLLKIKFVLCF